MLEREIEEKVRLWAIPRGWLVYKFTSPSKRSLPDRLFLRGGRAVFIEFKTPQGRLTPGQKREIGRIQDAGCECYVCRSVEDAQRVLGPV